MLLKSWFGIDVPTVGAQDVGGYALGRGVIFICKQLAGHMALTNVKVVPESSLLCQTPT